MKNTLVFLSIIIGLVLIGAVFFSVPAAVVDPDDPETRASNVFRNQLMSVPTPKVDSSSKLKMPPKVEMPQVQVVQKEPRVSKFSSGSQRVLRITLEFRIILRNI